MVSILTGVMPVVILWMPSTLEEIKAPIALEMEKFELKFRAAMQTRILLLDKIMNYIVKRKGKQMRPMFVFLSAGTCGNINESTHRGAALIELLHTATLVHDDVVDDANYRRGFFSINALWKNKVAVLVGDFLLSRGLIMSVENKDFELLSIVTRAVKDMSEGELLQMEKARYLNITEETYYQIIRQKTASLIASCCAVGAASAGTHNGSVEKMRLFGEKIGMAFQIKDDLLDYSDHGTGKPYGIDIREKKITLPLINALSSASSGDRRKIVRIIRSDDKKTKQVKEVIAFVRESGGLAYAEQTMKRYFDEALKLLDEFADSTYRQSLSRLVQFTIERNV